MFEKIKMLATKIKQTAIRAKERVQATIRRTAYNLTLNFCRLCSDVRGDGSMNFLITVVISVAIAAILIGVISNAIPGFWDTVQERITGLLGA